MNRNVPLTNIECFSQASDFIHWLSERRPGCIALDTETEGFDWWDDRIRLVQVGDANRGWSMSWDRWSGLIEEMFKKYNGRIVMHNFKFDSEFLLRYGIKLDMSRIDDTRTMAHLIDPDRLTGLKPLCDQIFGPGMSAGQDLLSQMMKSHKWNWRTIPIDTPIYWQYGAIDTVLTARLFDELEKQMSPYRYLYDIEMAAQIAIMNMEIRGASIDIDYCTNKKQELLDWAQSARAWSKQEYGHDFNIGSNKQVAKIMIADGWEPKVFTATGQPSITKEVLSNVNHPLAKTIVDIKHAEKMSNTYFKNFLESHDDGRLHCKINPLGARTGRMTVTNPSLNTLPRGPLIRDAFIPQSEVNQLLLVDYDQMEVRLGAHFFDDEKMIEDILTQDDVHTYVGCQIFGSDTITDQQRQTTKNAVYAILYNAGISRFAETAGIPTTEAKSFMNAYNGMYPGIRRFKKKLEAEAKNNVLDDGRIFTKTPYGRIQPVKPDLIYKLINYLIQGTGADVLKLKIAELDAAGLGEYMILPVHDEVAFDVPKQNIKEVEQEVKQIMTAEDFKVPLTVDSKIVNRWGDAYK